MIIHTECTGRRLDDSNFHACLEVLVALIDSAKQTIDVGTPGFSSWSKCSPFAGKNATCGEVSEAPRPGRMEARGAT